MNETLPLHRRPRLWYGALATQPSQRAAGELPRDDRRVRLPGLAMADLPAEIRQAPFDRRETSLL